MTLPSVCVCFCIFNKWGKTCDNLSYSCDSLPVAKVLPQIVPSVTPDGARKLFHVSRENGVAVVIVTVKVCFFFGVMNFISMMWIFGLFFILFCALFIFILSFFLVYFIFFLSIIIDIHLSLLLVCLSLLCLGLRS